MITIVECSDADTLFQIRSAVDGPFEESAKNAKVHREATKYATKKNGHQAFLAMEADVCVGYVEIVLMEPTCYEGALADKLDGLAKLAHIARIGLVESVRGRGIATALLIHAENWIKSNGKPGMWLGYLTKNEPAKKLYSRFGFTDLVEYEDPIKKRMRRIAMKQW